MPFWAWIGLYLSVWLCTYMGSVRELVKKRGRELDDALPAALVDAFLWPIVLPIFIIFHTIKGLAKIATIDGPRERRAIRRLHAEIERQELEDRNARLEREVGIGTAG